MTDISQNIPKTTIEVGNAFRDSILPPPNYKTEEPKVVATKGYTAPNGDQEREATMKLFGNPNGVLAYGLGR